MGSGRVGDGQGGEVFSTHGDDAGNVRLFGAILQGPVSAPLEYLRPLYQTADMGVGTPLCIPLRRVPSPLVSEGSTPYGDTPLVKSDALHASSVKPSALHWPLPSKPRSVRMAAGGLPVMILT